MADLNVTPEQNCKRSRILQKRIQPGEESIETSPSKSPSHKEHESEFDGSILKKNDSTAGNEMVAARNEDAVYGKDRQEPDSNFLSQSQGHDEGYKCTGVQHSAGGDTKLEDDVHFAEVQRSRNTSPTPPQLKPAKKLNREDSRIQISHLKQVLKTKEEKIEELNSQVKFFQERVSQHHQLETNNDAQNSTITDLRKELNRVQVERDNLDEELHVLQGEVDGQRSNQLSHLSHSPATKELDREREKNATLEVVKANLEAELTAQEMKISELEESIRDYTEQLTIKELSHLEVEKELKGERNFRHELDSMYQQREEKLMLEIANRQEQIDLGTAEKWSLQDKLHEVEADYKVKEKHLVVMATEKRNLEDQIRRTETRYSASQLELTDCRKQLETTTAGHSDEKKQLEDHVRRTYFTGLQMELARCQQQLETTIAENSRLLGEKRQLSDQMRQTIVHYNALQLEHADCCKQLKTTIADASRLNEEILAKTQQVRQYKKQMDSYRATLDDMADRREFTQREPQKEVPVLEPAKSRAYQVLIQRLNYELKKIIAQIPVKRVRSNPPIDLEPLAVHPDRPMRFDNHIGKGSYGSVYQVELNGQRCIAKRLHDILIGRSGNEQVSEWGKNGIHEKFVRECFLLSEVKHENIVRFMGVVIDRQDNYNLTLLMEQLTTDLHEYLLQHIQTMIPLSTKVSILHDISCGLLHLHQQSIIHRDLSASNVLLQIANGRPVQTKIADLGMSKFIDHNHPLTRAPGNVVYMSPESLLDQQYNDSLDIFSFGVICLFAAIQEFPIVSHERVSDAVHRKGEDEIFKRKQWIDMMEAKQPELSPLVQWCLQYDAMKRPSTFCLNIILEEMRKDYQ